MMLITNNLKKNLKLKKNKITVTSEEKETIRRILNQALNLKMKMKKRKEVRDMVDP